MRKTIVAQLEKSPSDVDMLTWMTRLALELVGQGGLGYSFDSLAENRPNIFGEKIKRLLSVFMLRTLAH